MKKSYTTPELELLKLSISNDVLALSDPENSGTDGGYGQGSASENPFDGGGF